MSAVVLFNAEGLIHFLRFGCAFHFAFIPKADNRRTSALKGRTGTFHLSDSNVSGTCVAGDGCGLCLRAFPVRFRAGVEAGAGEANLVRVLFGCGRERDW